MLSSQFLFMPEQQLGPVGAVGLDPKDHMSQGTNYGLVSVLGVIMSAWGIVNIGVYICWLSILQTMAHMS